ncbi:unnamed protein product [Allacma fusca]|uniref:Uncharacterized protein n=1 Tax=Allacma fusca TaxID=39272 RepID=A0A8J2JV85_9HEXA|nr:unnamed protein product [Allacma fusca]
MEVHNISLESCECNASGHEMEEENDLRGLTADALMDNEKDWMKSLTLGRDPRLSGPRTERNPLSCYYENASWNFRDIKHMFSTVWSAAKVLKNGVLLIVFNYQI